MDTRAPLKTMQGHVPREKDNNTDFKCGLSKFLAEFKILKEGFIKLENL